MACVQEINFKHVQLEYLGLLKCNNTTIQSDSIQYSGT